MNLIEFRRVSESLSRELRDLEREIAAQGAPVSPAQRAEVERLEGELHALWEREPAA